MKCDVSPTEGEMRRAVRHILGTRRHGYNIIVNNKNHCGMLKQYRINDTIVNSF
jgi:hypothetical protein